MSIKKVWAIIVLSCLVGTSLIACTSAPAPNPIDQPTQQVSQNPLPVSSPESSGAIKFPAAAGTLPVSAVAWTPDGKIMALGDSHGITLLDAHTLQDIRRIETQSWVRSLVFSPDGKWLAAGPAGDTSSIAPRGSISVRDVATGQLVRAWDSQDTDLAVGFQANGHTLATLGYDVLRLWDVDSGQLVRDFRQPSSSRFVVSPDFQHVFQEEVNIAAALWNLETQTHVPIENNFLSEATFSPDSRHLAVLLGNGPDISDTVNIFNVNDGQIERRLDVPWFSNSLAFSRDGRQLAIGGNGEVIQLWDVEAGQLRHVLEDQNYSSRFAFSPDGTRLAAADGNQLRWWDTQTGQLLQTVEALEADRIFYSPDGRFLADQNEVTLRLWDAATRQLVRTFDTGPLEELVFTADDRLLLLKPTATTLWQWDPATQQFTLHSTLPGSGSALMQPQRPAAISPDGRIVAVLNLTSTIQLLDTQSGQTLHLLKGHTGSIIDLKFSRDGAQLISSGELPQFSSGPARNSELLVWDVRSGQLLAAHKTTPWLVYVAGQPSDQTLLTARHQPDSCSRHGTHDVALYSMGDLSSDRVEVSPQWAHSLRYFDWVTLSADGRISAVAEQSWACVNPGPVQVWNTQTGALLTNVSLSASVSKPVYVTSLALNPDGSILAIGADDGSLTMWDVNNGQRLHIMSGLTANAMRLIFAPDGQLLISGNKDGQIQMWEVRSGQPLQTFSGHTAEVTHLLSGHQGRFLISGSSDGTARLWDLGEDHPPAPVAALFTSSYHTVSLETLANAATIFDQPPIGSVKWSGVPFELAKRIFKTQAAPDNAYPVTGTLTVNIPAAARLYVLLNTGDGFVKFKDKTIGQIVVTCNDQRLVVSDLQPGQNIREWVNSTDVISSAFNTLEVWNGPASSSAAWGHADLLTFALPEPCQQGTLTQVELIDTSRDTVGSLDPALNVFGMTIESRTR